MVSRGNRSRISSRGLRRLERERKKEQDHMQDGHETRVDLDEATSQGERSVSYILEHSYHSERDQEIENLQKQVKELELEIRGRHRRRDREESSCDQGFTGGNTGVIPPKSFTLVERQI